MKIIPYKNIFKTFKKFLILLVLLFIYISVFAFSYASTISNNISQSVFRLHIIANSDSKEDQELKLKVRDELILYMNQICKNCKNKEEVILIAKENINNFKTIAKNIIINNGYNYNVNVEINNYNFPTKTYGDISLPSGYYDALKVEIGNAKGQNWWCVMFPPLCFVNITSGIVPDESKKELKNNLSNEEYMVISNSNDNNYNFKFKIIELFNLTNLLGSKK